MKVWQVGVSDCESSHTICVCATKEIALREMFKKRDQLLEDWKGSKVRYDKQMNDYVEEKAKQGVFLGVGEIDNMWERMITALSHDDYQNWDNYPHDVPWIHESEIIDK